MQMTSQKDNFRLLEAGQTVTLSGHVDCVVLILRQTTDEDWLQPYSFRDAPQVSSNLILNTLE